MARWGMIGFGAIGRSVVQAVTLRPVPGLLLAALLVRARQIEEVRARLPDAVVTTEISAFLAAAGGIVVEAAGQPAVIEHGQAVLAAGRELHVISTGALADPALRARLDAAAATHGGRIAIPAGALAGFDGLMSLRRAGLVSVTYTSAKPPAAWRGTLAETLLDLDRLTERIVFFRGNAREAALSYPKNANLSASVALAGLGFEATRVELVADPALTGNMGRIEARTADQEMVLTMSGRSSPNNPRTSSITGMSILSALENRANRLIFI